MAPAAPSLPRKCGKKLSEKDWQITVIDRDWQHHYQPGWLFIPFGIYTAGGLR